ncbi:MAG: type IV toxin-antitoxin system AbiEi family antitoxin domain-containing protein [Sporichthyaceae bacterium]
MDLYELALAQGGVFSMRQAAEHGLTAARVRTMRRRGEVLRLREGVYAPVDLWGEANEVDRHAMEVAAALLIRGRRVEDLRPPALVAGFRSAGCMWGLPCPHDLVVAKGIARPQPDSNAPARLTSDVARASWLPVAPSDIDLVSGRSRRAFRAGVEEKPAGLTAEDLATYRNVPLTSLARTAVDLMRHVQHHDGLIVADAALRAGLEQHELVAVAERCRAWAGGQQALQLAWMASPLAETAIESLARWVCWELGLPEPELQVRFHDADGLIGRVDLYFRPFRTILEPDGAVKYLGSLGDPREVRERQRAREERLRGTDNEVVRTTWRELLNDRARLHARLLGAFARGQRLTG